LQLNYKEKKQVCGEEDAEIGQPETTVLEGEEVQDEQGVETE